jgi:eukaryotic-like serine/threonine-protein kinase
MNDTPSGLGGSDQTHGSVAHPTPSNTPQPESEEAAHSAAAPTAVPAATPEAAGRTRPSHLAVPSALEAHPRYEILARLGSGGMGTVYKARHRLMERLVALKVINPALVGWPEAVRRFRQEIRAAARLTHPNIVAAYDAEQAGDTHFLVMEYVEGVSLDCVLADEGPLPVERACDYARQAALGLEHAYARGMVHRDVKPHNLMLTPAEVVKILDFGLARFASEVPRARAEPPAADLGPLAPAPDTCQDSLDTATALARRREPVEGTNSADTGLGTPDYMAPEEGLDPRRADIRADVYSLGCTLYRLLTGQVPFPGGAPQDKLRAHRESVPRPVTELRPEVSAALAQVVGRMMARDPEQRYQTPGEAARALAPFAAPPAHHVLVVDDNPGVREVMANALGSQGYRVSKAADGREALELLRRGPLPDLILLDLMMPGMDGWEFLRERRHDAALAAVPVIIVSALNEDQARAVALGVAGHLQKPVELEDLGAAVRQHTAKG